MFTPRPYLSYSQMSLFEMYPEKYKEQYIYGKKPPDNVNMAYGSRMAEGLEKDDATGDPILDLVMARLPKFEMMDKPIYATLKRKDGDIPLLAKPDTARTDLSGFKEYKTSVRNWTQKMADESGQITFYATVMWLITNQIPQEIELIHVKTKYDEDTGALIPTGEISIFPTERTMVDIIKMMTRMKYAWKGIIKLCEKELV